jgi:hypothetical protein
MQVDDIKRKDGIESTCRRCSKNFVAYRRRSGWGDLDGAKALSTFIPKRRPLGWRRRA